MSLEEFKRQVQNQFAVVLSWDEVRALQKLYGGAGKLGCKSSLLSHADLAAARLNVIFDGGLNMHLLWGISSFPRCEFVPIVVVAQNQPKPYNISVFSPVTPIDHHWCWLLCSWVQTQAILTS